MTLLFRALRVVTLIAVIAAIGWRFLPRLLVKIVGDRIYLREEFIYPTTYRSGGFTLLGFSFGERTADCSRMERPRAAIGRNLLVGAGLDDECGWIFIPHLGGKIQPDRTAGGGVCFCLREEGEQIIQEVDLTPLAEIIDRGELRVILSGRVRGGRADLACDQLSQAEPRYPSRGAYRRQQESPETGWHRTALGGDLFDGTRALRVTLRRGVGQSALFGPDACFDDLSLMLERR